MKKHAGKIYFVAAPLRIKIGFTTRPEARLAQLRQTDMEELQVLHIVDSFKPVEKMLHDLLAPYRIKGEWFNDCPNVRTVIADFTSGRLAFNVAEPLRPSSSDFLCQSVQARNSAEREAHSLLDEIERRIARRESVSDLVRSACFLAENIIAPVSQNGSRTT